MAATKIHVRTATEQERVIGWRLEELQRAGYGATVARRLARATSVDLHIAIDLLRKGCSPQMAARILL